jgi:hypothetical protein
MAAFPVLSASEFSSLKTIGASFDQSAATEPNAAPLIRLKLVLKVGGTLRLTHAGRAQIIHGR